MTLQNNVLYLKFEYYKIVSFFPNNYMSLILTQ